MVVWMVAVGSSAIAADAWAPPLVVPEIVTVAPDRLPPPIPPPPPGFSNAEWDGRRLKTARNLRDAGVVLTFGGLGVGVVGLGVLAAGLANGDGGGVFGAGVAMTLGGGLAMLAGPPVMLAGGYTARALLLDLGYEPRGYALDVLAWISYGLGYFTGIGYVVSVGLGWGYANTMIQQADRALHSPGGGERRLYIRAVPTWEPQTRRGGLRVDVAF